jgi:16S rRNA (adenine1518-N6/adenine1519-N6)-dimethyltransferase
MPRNHLKSNLTPPPKKSLGQCFLTERGFACQIAAALGLAAGDSVLEIGPGRGILTEELVKSPARVVAIEIDGRLIESLREKFPTIELKHRDFLECELDEAFTPPTPPLQGGGTDANKVTGNLPYHLVSEVLFKLFAHVRLARCDTRRPWISTAVLMMQKEVAERIVSPQGSKTYGLTSVFTQLEGTANLMFTVPAEAFKPEPKVDGAVVRLDFYKIPPAYPENFQVCERILRYCFHQRRKMLKRTLSQLAGIHPFWQNADLDFTRRPETLSPEEWVTLSNVISLRQHIGD